MAKVIRVGIVGSTGYVGQELVRLLLDHPQVEIKIVGSQSNAGKRYSQVYPSFAKLLDLTCVQDDPMTMSKSVDVLFFALPHGAAAEKVTAQLLERTAVIDLGSDFRLKEASAYETWYGFKHPHPELLEQSVYGLCEWRRNQIKSARLIASPGCYATGSILALKPLLQAAAVDTKTVIVDAKSGVSGAGRSLALGVHFDECNESIKPYKVASHRHTPEIEQEVRPAGDQQFALTFTPHLVPMNRGILVTAYGSLAKNMDEETIRALYKKAYGSEHFIRLYEPGGDYEFPETRWVKGTNFCDIGLKVDSRANRVIVVSALDNLIKGAAGQAVQSMNILFGLEEATGLTRAAVFPA